MSITAPFYAVGWIRQMDQVAQQHHLSLFATDAAARYRAEGPIPDTLPFSTTISRPMNGDVLKGEGIFSATATDYFLARVELRSPVTG